MSRTDRVGKPAESGKLFDAEAIGSSLQQLAVDVVRGEQTDFMSRWFRTPRNDADLVIWTDSQKRIIKHQLCFYGQVVEWNPINGTRTGFILEEEVESEVSETIRFDQAPQDQVVHQAIRVLSFVNELSDTDRAHLIFNLRESPRMHKRTRERALQAWAPKVEEIVSSNRPNFWRRLRDWVFGD